MRILALTATIALCATAMLECTFWTIGKSRCMPNGRAKVAAKQSNKQWKKAGC